MIRTTVDTSYGPAKRVCKASAATLTAAFASAPVKLDQTYVTPAETHNPIELQGATAMWDGDNLTIYEESQGVFNMRGVLAQMFGLPKENVRVITKFVGSGFGSKLWPWTHCPLAVAAARQLGKPVKLVLSRKDDVPDVPVIARAPSSGCGSARHRTASSSRSSTTTSTTGRCSTIITRIAAKRRRSITVCRTCA